jgi:ABC-type microcin C transport system duplicated ATPase subunit YejF
LADRDLLKLRNDEMRQVRGREIGMAFRVPTMLLSPVFSIGLELTEPMSAI